MKSTLWDIHKDNMGGRAKALIETQTRDGHIQTLGLSCCEEYVIIFGSWIVKALYLMNYLFFLLNKKHCLGFEQS